MRERPALFDSESHAWILVTFLGDRYEQVTDTAQRRGAVRAFPPKRRDARADVASNVEIKAGGGALAAQQLANY